MSWIAGSNGRRRSLPSLNLAAQTTRSGFSPPPSPTVPSRSSGSVFGLLLSLKCRCFPIFCPWLPSLASSFHPLPRFYPPPCHVPWNGHCTQQYPLSSSLSPASPWTIIYLEVPWLPPPPKAPKLIVSPPLSPAAFPIATNATVGHQVPSILRPHIQPSPSLHPQRVWLGSGPHRFFPDDFTRHIIGHPAQSLSLSASICTAAPEKCFKYKSETTLSFAPSDSFALHGLLNKASHSKERRARHSVIWPFPGAPQGGIFR